LGIEALRYKDVQEVSEPLNHAAKGTVDFTVSWEATQGEPRTPSRQGGAIATPRTVEVIERSIERRQKAAARRPRKERKGKGRDFAADQDTMLAVDQEGVIQHAAHVMHSVYEKEQAIVHKVEDMVHSADVMVHKAVDALVHKEQEIVHKVDDMIHHVGDLFHHKTPAPNADREGASG